MAKKKAAQKRGKRTARASAATKHKKLRIGLSKNLRIKADGTTVNTFRVYGDSIGKLNPNTSTHPDHKHVKTPTAKHHTFSLISWSDVDDNSIEIKATAARTFAPFFGSDDLTITIVLDELTPDPDVTECTFDDVDYV
jgi:hypothetical protein